MYNTNVLVEQCAPQHKAYAHVFRKRPRYALIGANALIRTNMVFRHYALKFEFGPKVS